MSLYVIPTSISRDTSDYVQTSVIDGRTYILRFYWNQRSGIWHLDLRDHNNDPIVSGVALVLGAPLLRNVTDPRRPPGELFLYDRTQQSLPPNIDELGGRIGLFYVNHA